ncbi:antitoxin of toxin-antitoxin stability system [Marinactinospora rubrisoli]|uniref:Antitoxin of toxin-antitoxin stability system n=1 Tax=Marinactinospora rubrisoli TaxID=2715399 RepID=A0ABW2KKB9_9ACTN
MSAEPAEYSIRRARDEFSQVVNRAAFGGEITYITRGRGHRRAAAVVPAEWVEAYEEYLDREDGWVAEARLADLRAGRSQVIPAEEVGRTLGS